MSDFVVAIGLVFVIEGLLYALVPGALQRMMVSLIDAPESTLRVAGLVAVSIGVAVVWLIRG